MEKRQIQMDVMSELASEITEYIWGQYHEGEHSFTLGNELKYVPKAQKIHSMVLDIIDDNLNGVDAPSLGE